MKKLSWRRRYYLFNVRWEKFYRLLRNWAAFSFLLSFSFNSIWTIGESMKLNGYWPVVSVVRAAEEPMEHLIRRIATETNFQWPDYLVRLANCETAWTLDPFTNNAKGNTPAGSIDRGLFGINDHWHKEVANEQAYNPEWATRWTIERINAGYQHEWSCDPLIKANPKKYD